MDFDSAVQAHMEWKFKLAAYIRNPDHSLDPLVVGLDNRCPLGQWIHGEGGAQYGTIADFADLKTKHATFHREAASIVRRADAGETLQEGSALDNHSDYGKASLAVIVAINIVKRQAA